MVSVEQSIRDGLTEFGEIAVAEGKIGLRYDQLWTEEILKRLSNEGKKRRFEVHIRKEFDEYRMPDLVWFGMEDGVIRAIPLLVMVEWRPSPWIEMRFATLANVRAHLRVCILDATFPDMEAGYAKAWAEDKISELCDRASKFDKSEEADRYLFCIWCRDVGDGEWLFASVPE